MSRKIIDPFDTPENYVFSSEIEITGGVSRLVPQVIGAEAALYFKLDENDGLVAIDSSGNNRHGAFQGGFDENQWTTGKINSAIQGISTTNGFINIDQLLEYEYNESFSIGFWALFTSTATQSFVSKQKDTGVFEGFAINALSGKLRFVVRDIAFNVLAIETASIYNDGAWHYIVGTYDGSGLISGVNLYVDNSLDKVISSSATLTSSIKNDADFQVSGRDGNNLCLDAGTKIDEVAVYSRELTPAEIDFRWNGGAGTQEIPGASTSYPTTNPYLISKSTFSATEIISFFATIIKFGLDDIRFALIINNIDTWWDGFAWATSTDYSETNTPAEILANLSSLDLSQGLFVNYKAYFHSDDGSTTPELSSVEFNFDFFKGVIDAPNQCLVYGILYDDDNFPLSGIGITVTPSQATGVYNKGSVVCLETKQTTTDVNGYWDVSLTETDHMSGITYTFEFDCPGSVEKYVRKIPDFISINFSELVRY